MFQIYILYILFQTVFTQAIYNCQETAGTYKRGDSIIICLFFLNDATPNTPYRMVYSITVDKFTALLAPGAYMALSQAGSTSLNVLAPLLTPTNTTKYITSSGAFPMNSIVIRMSKGIVNEVFWDNVCFNVGSCESTAPDGSSAQGLNNDLVQCNTPYDCDPKLYVSFVGSDSQGQYMTSSGLRMSQFQAYNTAQIYSTAQNAFSQVTQ